MKLFRTSFILDLLPLSAESIFICCLSHA